jgi:DNA-binding transcriptional MerR regulator
MAILDQVIQMQKEGMQNPEILRALQEQGISPSEINEAINQAQIKGAVNSNPMEQQEQTSVMSQPMAPEVLPSSPVPMDTQAQQAQPVPQDNYYAQAPQGYDPNYDTGGYTAGTVDPDSVTEIAQQVVEEEFKNYKKKTGDMGAFKTETESKLTELSERIKRIESTIDKLQHSVIQKIGEFGENTAYIRRDLENLHDTTSKLMNPLIDNLNKTSKHSTHKKSSKKKK